MPPKTKQFQVPIGYGNLCGQIFGNSDNPNGKPIIALHGYLDNSNSFRPVSKYLTTNGDYYIIALDLPGMGLSSKVPDGIPYSTKFFVMAVRRVVKHFNLDKFTILAHSFGCSMALAYTACYPDDVSSIILIDFAMKDCDIYNKESVGECWRDCIDTYLKAEETINEKKKQSDNKELTYEHALTRLLQSNKHIDEMAAKILLERGLILIDGKFEYSRDIKLVTGISMKDYHAEYIGIYDSLFSNIKSPLLYIHADPPPYGQQLFDQLTHIMDLIKAKSQSTVDIIPFQGTHHFHMLNPAETANLVKEFLDKKTASLVDSNNNNNNQIDNVTIILNT